MKRNGTTKAGTRRWRCPKCGASSVRKHDNAAKALGSFLRWLLSKDAIADLKVSRTTFWRKTAWIWRIWPIAPFTGEVHDVVFLDGIWLRRKAVVLIAVADGHVVAWHLARTECASAWAALMLRVPAPKMAVCDGSPGFAKAAAAVWPETRIQRCTFHVAAQVRRCTTLRPRLEAGIELLGIASDDNPIPGLYNVGTMVGDAFCGTYTFQVEGANYGMNCLTFGYLTGKYIAENE